MVDLSQFDDMYQKAVPPEGGDFENPPDGRYQALLDKFELAEVGDEKKPVLRFSLRVMAGPQVDKIISKSSFITPKTLEFVKKDLSLLGFNGKLSELNSPDVRMQFIGKVIEVQVQRKGEYNGKPNVNVYLNRVVDVAKAFTAPAGAGASPNDPPF